MSCQPGASTEASRAVTSASSRSPATTSSISRTERSCPIASGDIDCGKTTVSFSGSTGSAAGYSRAWSTSSGVSKLTSVIRGSGSRPGRRSCAPHLDRDAARRRGMVSDGELDREHAVLEACARVGRVDVLGQAHLPLERADLDLHLLVDAARDLGALALAGDDQDAFADRDADALRVDARQFDDD